MNITIQKKTNGSFDAIYDAFKFVSTASNKYDCRPYINCVHYQDTTLLGTNGHRLHTVEIDLNRTAKIDNGAYKIVKLNKREIVLEPQVDTTTVKIPDSAWKFIIPEKTATNISEILPPATSEDSLYRYATNVYRLISKLGIIDIDGRDYGYNYNYLADALEHGAIEIYRNKGSRGLLIIKSDQYSAAIMPMRL